MAWTALVLLSACLVQAEPWHGHPEVLYAEMNKQCDEFPQLLPEAIRLVTAEDFPTAPQVAEWEKLLAKAKKERLLQVLKAKYHNQQRIDDLVWLREALKDYPSTFINAGYTGLQCHEYHVSPAKAAAAFDKCLWEVTYRGRSLHANATKEQVVRIIRHQESFP